MYREINRKTNRQRANAERQMGGEINRKATRQRSNR
jgi:hypothetical protein